MNERDTKFFRPLWLRVGLTVALAIWLAAEILLSRDQLWMFISGVALAYAVWNFFLTYPKDPSGPAPGPDPKP